MTNNKVSIGDFVMIKSKDRLDQSSFNYFEAKVVGLTTSMIIVQPSFFNSPEISFKSSNLCEDSEKPNAALIVDSEGIQKAKEIQIAAALKSGKRIPASPSYIVKKLAEKFASPSLKYMTQDELDSFLVSIRNFLDIK